LRRAAFLRLAILCVAHPLYRHQRGVHAFPEFHLQILKILHPPLELVHIFVHGCLLRFLALTGPDGVEDVALGPDIAVHGQFELAAQDRMDDERRIRDAVRPPDEDAAIGFLKRQLFQALGRLAPRPAARIAGLALAELRMPGRLAVADVVGVGFRLGCGQEGGSYREGEGQSGERSSLRGILNVGILQKGRAPQTRLILIYNQ
jgi:hypothetical protein